MGLRDDLRNAKALISTPAKCSAIDIYGAIRGVTDDGADEGRFVAMQTALRIALPRPSDRLSTYYRGPRTHRAVMQLFDRAIANAEITNG